MKLTILALLLGSLLFGACTTETQRLQPPSGPAPAPPTRIDPTTRAKALLALKEAVVIVELSDGSYGTGVPFLVRDSWTYILTAAHVVEDDPAGLSVRTYQTPRFAFPAELLRIHERYDAALIRVPVSLRTLPVAKSFFGGVGSEVYAVGYPMDIWPALTTIGYIQPERIPGLIYHSASCWFGSSGGPLILADTFEVIGLNVYGYDRRSDRVGAVPIEQISTLTEVSP